MHTLHFDLAGGICGDMLLGSLVDLAVPFDHLTGEISKLGLAGLSLSRREVRRGGVAVTKIDVLARPEHVHRNLAVIRDLIERAPLSPGVQDLAVAIFTRLARAESEVHGTTIEQIHFHEVGALDSIADIVGAAICIDHLAPRSVSAGPLHFGTGSVRCAHGILPVPVPAVRALTKGLPAVQTSIEGERVTPTGAAVLVTLLDRLGTSGDGRHPERSGTARLDPQAVSQVGRGAGDREDHGARGYLEIRALDGPESQQGER